ncbi:MAG: xylulokinase [Sphaerochaetaceae bacterium]
MYIGVDCGTQGTKVIVYDHKNKEIIGEGYTKHDLIALENGRREQDPQWWIDAFEKAMDEALSSVGKHRREIRGIGVSGQQHGLVILDNDRNVLRDSKLWNDTETAAENQKLIDLCGGESGVIGKIGTGLPVGYTASKVLWVKENEPEIYSRIATVCNPKDYLNYYLTGRICTDIGSASGTGYFNVNSLKWSDEVISLMDDSGILRKALPEVVPEGKPIGTISSEIARRFSLSDTVIVSPGSGDNMMAALGTGNVEDGNATLSLGTSGVLSIYSSKNEAGYFDPITQIQCAGNGGWIPTVMTMNATSTSTAFQQLFDLTIKEFDQKLTDSEPGAEGVILIPFLNGERMPPLPDGKGLLYGLTLKNLQKKNLIRASAESVLYGLRWGRDLLTKNTGKIKQLRITGGGSNSAPWRQMAADIMNTEVVGVNSRESGSLGAALQAMWADGVGDITRLCAEHVSLDYSKHAVPDPGKVKIYDEAYSTYIKTRRQMFGI